MLPCRIERKPRLIRTCLGVARTIFAKRFLIAALRFFVFNLIMTQKPFALLLSALLLFVVPARAEWFFSFNASTYSVPMSPVSIALADVNMDGSPDIVIAHDDAVAGGFSILTNKGDGTFSAAPFVYSGMMKRVLAEDVNGDGRPDLLGLGTTDAFSVHTNNGNGFEFAASTRIGLGTASEGILLADLNNDGWKEIVVMHGGPLIIYTNDHHGTFTFSTNFYTGGFYPYKGVAGNFNGDGSIDVFVSHYEDAAVLMTNNGAGFLASGLRIGPGGPFTPRAADINRDGLMDVVANETLLTNNGLGSFVVANTNIAGNGDTLLGLADLNGDGWMEVLAAGDSGGRLKVRTNDHSNVFATAAKLPASSDIVVAAADVNGDGWSDLIYAARYANQVGVFFHYQNLPLKIERTANTVKVSWPFTTLYTDLQSTTNLTPTATWNYRSPFTNVSLMRLEFSTSTSEGLEFFRLRY